MTKFFEELGYTVVDDGKYIHISKCIDDEDEEYKKTIIIYKASKTYTCGEGDGLREYYPSDLTLEEHKLLTELFKSYGWL